MPVLSDSAACGLCTDTVWPGDIQTAKKKKIKVKICSKESCIRGVSFASSPFCHKNVVTHLHFHWLKGPKCKLTQITEVFALIKYSTRAFKESTLSHKSFTPWTIDLYIPSFTINVWSSSSSNPFTLSYIWDFTVADFTILCLHFFIFFS